MEDLMPLYTATTQLGVLSAEAKSKLADVLATFHSKYAGIPKAWVQVVFQEYAPGSGFSGGQPSAVVALTLVIRTGRSSKYKGNLIKRVWDLLQEATGAPDNHIAICIQEVPPSQAMETGQIMPEVTDQYQTKETEL
jgi:phenylpyruvate tautomerase PptA (4-oxalocrotonate tautomerase family)